MEIEPAQKVTLTESVMKQLIPLILNGAYAAGEKLPSQHELARRFGVGITCIREAMQGLAVMKLIEIKPGRGAFVARSEIARNANVEEFLTGLEKAALDELFEARKLIEVDIVRLAAERADAEQIRKMEGLLHEMDVLKSDVDAVFRLHTAFHLAIARGAKNSILEQVLDSTLRAMAPVSRGRVQAVGDPAFYEGDIDSHRGILEAIREGDGLRAERAMEQHFDLILSRLGLPARHAKEPE